MPYNTALIYRCHTVVTCAAVLLALNHSCVQAATVTVPLNAQADLTSNFNTYWSHGIAQLNLTYPGTSRQPFWNTDDLNQTYNSSFDFFPNDSAMQFGQFTYDDSSLISGSGTATITNLILGIEKDPLSSHVNGTWLSFSTDLGTYSGTVKVTNGAVSNIDLTANYTSTGYFGPTPINASGTFSISGDKFQVLASGYNPSLGTDNPSVAWNWTGTILNLATVSLNADFNGNGVVDAADYVVWRNNLNSAGVTPYTLGDANGDGQVTATDYQIWRSQFGAPPPAGGASISTAVPEPANVVNVAIAGALLALRRSSAKNG